MVKFKGDKGTKEEWVGKQSQREGGGGWGYQGNGKMPGKRGTKKEVGLVPIGCTCCHLVYCIHHIGQQRQVGVSGPRRI